MHLISLSFFPDTTVMAIYPQTTCFYKGVIKEQPKACKQLVLFRLVQYT